MGISRIADQGEAWITRMLIRGGLIPLPRVIDCTEYCNRTEIDSPEFKNTRVRANSFFEIEQSIGINSQNIKIRYSLVPRVSIDLMVQTSCHMINGIDNIIPRKGYSSVLHWAQGREEIETRVRRQETASPLDLVSHAEDWLRQTYESKLRSHNPIDPSKVSQLVLNNAGQPKGINAPGYARAKDQ